tara:strand:- start:4145 stop:4417 length:273 start_codon:yes stop_codon:yes gene_type:complete
MDIRKIKEGTYCHYCHQEFNGVEEGLVQKLPNGEDSYYHLRCVGKLMVYRIEGVLPQHLFMACVDKLNNPLPNELKDVHQTKLDDYTQEE